MKRKRRFSKKNIKKRPKLIDEDIKPYLLNDTSSSESIESKSCLLCNSDLFECYEYSCACCSINSNDVFCNACVRQCDGCNDYYCDGCCGVSYCSNCFNEYCEGCMGDGCKLCGSTNCCWECIRNLGGMCENCGTKSSSSEKEN